MFARLRHRTVSRRYDQNRTVHLRRTRNHVLYIVRVTRAVYVRIVTLRRFVLYVRGRNGDTASLFFRCLVNLIIGRKLRAALFRQYFRDRGRQRRLPVVYVTDRPDVAVRLASFKFLFCHLCFFLFVLLKPKS